MVGRLPGSKARPVKSGPGELANSAVPSALAHDSQQGSVNQRLAIVSRDGTVGIRATLSALGIFEIESNNCIPVTWFAAFAPGSFSVEERREGPETYEVALFRAQSEDSAHRLQSAIKLLRGKSSAWSFLRPLETIHDEICQCPAGTEIVLDATQFWQHSDAMRGRLQDATRHFGRFLQDATVHNSSPIALLDDLVSDLSIYPPPSVEQIATPNLAHIMFGTYWGEGQSRYNESYFDTEY